MPIFILLRMFPKPLLIITFFLASFHTLSAQNDTELISKNAIKAYPLISEQMLGYERRIAPKRSVEFDLGRVNMILAKTTSDWALTRFGEYDVKGIVVKVGYRVYPWGFKKYRSSLVPLSFYHGPQFTYRYIIADVTTYVYDSPGLKEITVPAKLHAFVFSYMFGCQAEVFRHFTIGYYTGAGIKSQLTPTKVEGRRVLEEILPDSPSFAFHLGINLGVLF